MKCITCRREEATDTWRDKIVNFLIYHLFPKTLKDEQTQAKLEGFGHGYEIGRKHERETSERNLNEFIQQFHANNNQKAQANIGRKVKKATRRTSGRIGRG